MTKLITISFPHDDTVAAHHLGEALLGIAAAREERPYPIVKFSEDVPGDIAEDKAPVVVEQDLTVKAPESNPNNYAPGTFIYMVAPNEVDCRLAASDAERDELLAEGWEVITKEQFESWEPKESGHPGDLDKEGIPWDERIHSGSKNIVKDGTWRLRKKPKEMTEGQWADEVAKVKASLKQPEVAEQGDDFNTDEGVVTEQDVAGIPPVTPPTLPVPPIPVEAPANMPAPPIPVDAPANMPAPDAYNGPTNFPDLMTFLVDHASQTQPHLAVTCARAKIETVRDLHSMPEAIPAFYTDLINTCGLQGK